MRSRLLCVLLCVGLCGGVLAQGPKRPDDNKVEWIHGRKELFARFRELEKAVKDGHGHCLECYQKYGDFLEQRGSTTRGPGNARAWAQAAAAAGNHAQYIAARRSLASLLTLKNQSAAKVDGKEMTEAEQAIGEVVADSPQRADWRFLHGQTLAMLQRDDEAATEFGKVAEASGADPNLRRLAKRFAAHPALGRHRVMPSIRVTLADGRPLDLAEWRGRAVLLDVWASWCALCRSQAPHLKETVAPYAGHRFAILSVSVDDDLKAWRKAMEKDELPWAQAIDGDLSISIALGISPIPRYILIDDEGVVLMETRYVKELPGAVKDAVYAADERFTAIPKKEGGL